MQPVLIHDILKLIPHRYPFLLVDKVVAFEIGKSIKTIKCVTANEPFFQGHFPGNPVMPGVLMVEALAQSMALLAFKSLLESGVEPTGGEVFYFAGIDKARFKRPVFPGDVLTMEVKLIKQKGQIWKAEGTVYVDGQLACAAEIMASYKG